MKNIKNFIGREKKFCFSLLVVTIIFVFLIKFLTMTAITSNIPTLWVNDEVYQYHERYPLELINGVPFVPADLFSYIRGVTLGGNEESFYIQYKINNTWISFDTKSNGAWTNYGGMREDFYEPTYILNGTRYVRAAIVTDLIEIDHDYNSQYGVLRFKDRSARRPLDDLISGYIELPTEPPHTVPPTTEAPITAPPPTPPPPTTEPFSDYSQETTVEPSTAEDTREIVNYLMFHGGNKNYTAPEHLTEAEEFEQPIYITGADTDNLEYLLDILARENIQSIFFLTRNGILENPDILRKIYAMGHEVGIEIENREINFSSDDLLAELEKVNALIYTATKHKTRFYIFDENIYKNISDAESDEFMLNCIENLKKEGYYHFTPTLEMSDFYSEEDITEIHEDENISKEVKINKMIEYLKCEEINIIKFKIAAEKNEYEDLNLVVSAVQRKFYITVKKISLPFFLNKISKEAE